MKKIIALMLIAGLSTSVYAQKGNAFSRSFDNNNQAPAMDEAADGPGTDGLGGQDPAPIDDYIPLLALAGAGMAVYFGRKKYILSK